MSKFIVGVKQCYIVEAEDKDEALNKLLEMDKNFNEETFVDYATKTDNEEWETLE